MKVSRAPKDGRKRRQKKQNSQNTGKSRESRKLGFRILKSNNVCLRCGQVILGRTHILSGIKFTTHFIEFFVVATKRFVGSSVNVILTRQTCGQSSSRAAESKRRALENYFPERICYMFHIPKCRGDWDLGRYTFGVLAFGKQLRNHDFRKKTFFARRKNQNLALRSVSLFGTTIELFRFHNRKIDEMRCKLDSTENACSFEKYPTSA